MPSVEGLAPRRTALKMLDAVLRRGQMLSSAASSTHPLAAADQALAAAIAGETLRRIPDLDRWIDSATRQRLPDDSKARMVLRLALAQKVGLGTPDHAIVATALPLVDGGPRRLVHGVLGTLLRGQAPDMSAPHLPKAVEKRWRAMWGDAVVSAARQQIAMRPPLDLTFTSESEAASFAEVNDGVRLAPWSVRLTSGNVAEIPGYEAGQWWVQDLAASLAARLVPSDALAVADLCAAPGGKTMQLAAAGHRVAAVDSSGDRLKRLRTNLDRTGLTADLFEADAVQWTPRGTPNAILLDAPCSATGTFRRHPEVLYRARDLIIAQSSQLQARLLDRAASWLEPGGTLVYCVCSLERPEGEDVIAAFTQRHPDFLIRAPEPGELPDGVPIANEGWVRVLPGLFEAEGGLDGFFIARLIRVSESVVRAA